MYYWILKVNLLSLFEVMALRHLGTWVGKHAKNVGMSARKARDQGNTQETLAREHAEYTLAREHVSTHGTLARKARNLECSFANTHWSLIWLSTCMFLFCFYPWPYILNVWTSSSGTANIFSIAAYIWFVWILLIMLAKCVEQENIYQKDKILFHQLQPWP